MNIMDYSAYELVWFYLIYAFAGWFLEVCAAAFQKRAFINRGVVTGPLCPIYGAGAVLFAVFLPELKGNVFFLFLGGMILASLVEYFTGVLLETIFHRKWWDYSSEKWNFDGYICLKYSALWGLCALLLVHFVNPLFQRLVDLIPYPVGVALAWVLMAVLALDVLGTALAIRGLKKEMRQVSELTENLEHVSKLLENAITRRIRRRMKKAFPNLNQREKTEEARQEKSRVFARGCGFYKLAALFLIGSFLGDVVETIFCLFTQGEWMSRSSVVYGPFSIVWGLGCVLLTAILYRYRTKSRLYIFAAGTVLGGAYEYICSVSTELAFGTIFWDYSGFTFNLGGRINLLFCLFWGFAAVIWIKLLYPALSGWIEKIPVLPGKILCHVMLVFMVFNMSVSALALGRYHVRQTQEGKKPNTRLEQMLDQHFPDKKMERIYPNAKIV